MKQSGRCCQICCNKSIRVKIKRIAQKKRWGMCLPRVGGKESEDSFRSRDGGLWSVSHIDSCRLSSHTTRGYQGNLPPISVDMKGMSGGSRGALSGCHYNPIKPGAREAAQGGQFMSLPCKWGLWQEIAGLSEAWRT